jgi:predicted nucleotidyltransferase
MSLDVQGALADLRREFEALYGPRLVGMVLFGSQARGDAEEGSDIDVLMVLGGPVDPGAEIARTGRITATLSLKYNAVVSCTFVSAERYSKEKSPFLLNVRNEGVAL